MSTPSSLSVTVPQRTWRLLEARLQTIRARVIEASVYLDDSHDDRPLVERIADADEQLDVADDDLRVVLDLIRGVPQTPRS